MPACAKQRADAASRPPADCRGVVKSFAARAARCAASISRSRGPRPRPRRRERGRQVDARQGHRGRLPARRRHNSIWTASRCASPAPTRRWRSGSSPSTRTSTWCRPRRWRRTCSSTTSRPTASASSGDRRCGARPRELLDAVRDPRRPGRGGRRPSERSQEDGADRQGGEPRSRASCCSTSRPRR